jgi:hypothetical protein
MMRNGSLQKHLDEWVVSKKTHVEYLTGGLGGEVIDMKLYGNPIYGRQIGFDQNGRWMNISWHIFKALMGECYEGACLELETN